MTDTVVPTGGIELSPEMLRAKVEEIAQLDEQLDAASGSEAAGVRSLGKALSDQYSEAWKPNADKLVETINNFSDEPEKLAGIYKGIVNTLSDTFKTRVDEYLKAEVDANKENRPKVSSEQVAEWTEARKTLMEQYKAIYGILELFEQDVSAIPKPKSRVGARGKRGKQVLRGFDFAIDGVPRTEKQNTLSSIANQVMSPLNWKTPELINFLKENGVDTENPPNEYTIMLPDPVNKELSWKVRPVSLADQDEGEEDEVDEEEDEEDNGEE